MFKKGLKVLMFCLLVGFLLAACGGKGEEAADTGQAEKPKAEKAEKMSPKEMADKILSLYEEGMKEMNVLLEAKPDAAEVKPQLQELKEKYIQEYVKLGKIRETMTEQDRSTMQSNLMMGMNSFGTQDWYIAFNENQQYYFSKDQELHKLIMSFNVITQYAQFELLKQQEPEEAERLGIE